jgi:hypothetical protein
MPQTKLMRIFLVLLIATIAAFAFAFACDSGDDDDDHDDAAVADDDDQDSDDDADAPWTPVTSHRESYEHFTIAWYQGTPYEMGFQQGELLHEELAAGVQWIDSMLPIGLVTTLARVFGLYDLAMANSYPDIIEECQGMVAAAEDVGWTMDICMLLNFGDVLIEYIAEGFPPAKSLAPGCTQLSASGEATSDGRLYHGRSLDWSEISFLIDYPVIHVRQPAGGIPHVYIGFPGNLSPYQGINAAGISIASNEADPYDNTFHDRTGRSHVQLLGQMLKNVTSLDEAKTTMIEFDHMTVELIMVADGNSKTAAAFEMTAKELGIRDMVDGVVGMTNHFVAPETKDSDKDPAGPSTTKRLERLDQLSKPDGLDTVYGTINPEVMIQILRDRVDPTTGQTSAPDVFDDDSSIATNGAIYQVVFDPENLWFWVAAGKLPIPDQEFVGFSLGELLGLPDAKPVEPKVYE